MSVPNDLLDNLYEALLNLGTDITPYEARQAMVELLEEYRFSSLESAEALRALDTRFGHR